jgi:CRP-like cAMP-binding protein
MSVGFQSQFMSKLKEKEEKIVSISNNNKNSKIVPSPEKSDNPEETQNMISENNLSNKEQGEISSQIKKSYKDSTFNLSQTQTHESKLALLKGTSSKNNIFEILNKPKNEASSNKGKIKLFVNINKFLKHYFFILVEMNKSSSSVDSIREPCSKDSNQMPLKTSINKLQTLNNNNFINKQGHFSKTTPNLLADQLNFSNRTPNSQYSKNSENSKENHSPSRDGLGYSPGRKLIQANLDYKFTGQPTDNDVKVDFRKLTKREKICDSDTEDEGSDTEKDVTWILMPDNTYKRSFDILIALIIIYSSIVLPYKIAFVDTDIPSDVVVDNIFNAIMVIDIILNFFTAYVDNEDNIIKNRKKVIISYLQSWFIIDFVSVVPINYITDTSTSQYNALARLSRIPKLYRLVKLTKLFRMVKILKKGNVNKVTKFFLEKLKVNANIERLIYFILGFLLLNHLAACIWYFVAKMQDLNPDCWVTRLGYIDASNMEIYIVSFYWTLTTVTTVGYGDINAGTTIERIYNLFIMSFGVLMYSFAIGSLSSIVSTLDAKTAEMNQKLQILSSIKKEFSLDQEIYDKVRKVIKYDLSRNQKDKMNFLQELPNKLRIELSQIMHDSVIQKMYFFKDQPSDFIAYVAPLLKPVKFSQNDYLYKEGDMIDEMYFVSKGTISFCLGRAYLDKEVKEIKKHNNFGEIEMCLNEKLSFNIRVKSRNCELFVLKKNDFLRLSVNFKEFIEKFLQRSLMIYLRFNDDKKKIIKVIEEQNRVMAGAKGLAKGKTGDELEMIDEKVDEESEEYDIFGDNSESQTGSDENSGSSYQSEASKTEEEREENLNSVNSISNRMEENKSIKMKMQENLSNTFNSNHSEKKINNIPGVNNVLSSFLNTQGTLGNPTQPLVTNYNTNNSNQNLPILNTLNTYQNTQQSTQQGKLEPPSSNQINSSTGNNNTDFIQNLNAGRLSNKNTSNMLENFGIKGEIKEQLSPNPRKISNDTPSTINLLAGAFNPVNALNQINPFAQLNNNENSQSNKKINIYFFKILLFFK